MTDDAPFYSPFRKPQPPRQPQPGIPLFAFIRETDRAHIACELRNHGPYGWEAQYFHSGSLLFSRGGFPTRDAAVAWADAERPIVERREHD